MHHGRIVQNIPVLGHGHNAAEMHHILPLRKIADPELALVVIVRGLSRSSRPRKAPEQKRKTVSCPLFNISEAMV